MPLLGKQDGQGVTLESELPNFTPVSPLSHPYQESNAQANPDECFPDSDDIISEEGLKQESSKAGIFGSAITNTEAETDVENTGPWEENFEYHATDNQNSGQEFDISSFDNSTYDGALSPASQRLVQNASIIVSAPLPDVDGQFIQRHDSHKDVVEEINSAFKFATKENAHGPEKTTSTKANQKALESHKPLNIFEPTPVLVQFKNTPSLPQGSTANLNHGESSGRHQPLHHNSTTSTTPLDPKVSLNPEQHMPPSISKPRQEVSQATVPNNEGVAASLKHDNQDINALELGASSTQDAILAEKSTPGVNAPSFRSAHGVTILDASSRRLQSYQKVTPSSRIRIKQPFPEVAQITAERNRQCNIVAAPDRDNQQCGSQPRTVGNLPFQDVASSSQSVPPMSSHRDNSLYINSRSASQPYLQPTSPPEGLVENLNPKFSTQENPNERPNESPRSSLLGNGVLKTNTPLALNSWETKENELARNCTPYEELNWTEGFEEGLQTMSPEQKILGDPADSGGITTLHGAETSGGHAASQSPILENWIPVEAKSRSLSAQSQHQSYHDDLNTPTRGDIADQHANLKQPPESLAVHFSNSSKIKKSKPRQSYIKEAQRYSSSPIQQPFLSKVAQAQQNLFKHNQEVEGILKDCQKQKETIELQQLELEKLKSSNAESSKQIRALEIEKESLKAKTKKFEHLALKYKDHMNEVVMSQKKLLKDSQCMQKMEFDVKLFQETFVNREAHIKKLECLLQEAKDFRAPAEKLLAAQHENEELIKLVQDSSRTKQLLQNDLDRSIIELGRERHNCSQLNKQLIAQAEGHKELIMHLQSTRSGICDDLTNESGILAKLLETERSTQAKVIELLPIINAVKSHHEDFQPTLAQLIENLYIKIEDKIQSADDNDVLRYETHVNLFEDLKERIDQVFLDQKTQSKLNDVITELREANATLSSSLSARGAECQGMTARIAGLESELTSYRGLLNAKSDELAIALALPKDDPQLRAKCHDLENANIALQNQVDNATQETASSRKELDSVRETALETGNRLHELEGQFNEAQNLIIKLAEEKKQYVSNAKLDIEKARQEVAKASSAAKSEMIMRNDALVKNLEQRRTEAEAQVRHLKDELQRAQSERDGYVSSASQLEHELSTCKEENTKQASQIRQLELQSMSREALERQEALLECARGEIIELRTRLEHVRGETTGSLSAALRLSKGVEYQLRQVDDLEHENESLREQHHNLEEKYDALRESATRPIPGEYIHDAHCELVASQTPLEIGSQPSKAPAKKVDLNPSATRSSQLSGSQVSTVNLPERGSSAPSMDQPSHKPLKVANRSASNTAHKSNIMGSASSHRDTSVYHLQQSTVTQTSHMTQETTFGIQTPSHEIIPFSYFSPIQSLPPSSLTDVSPIMEHLESINSDENLRKLYAETRGNKQSGSQVERTRLAKKSDMPTPAQNTSSGATKDQYSAGYQLTSDNKGISGSTEGSIQPSEQKTTARELQEDQLPPKKPIPPKTSMTLKSALKKPSTFTKTMVDIPVASKPAPLLKNMPTGRAVSKNLRKSAPELGYKRVASGQSIKSRSSTSQLRDNPGGQATGHHQSQYQPANRVLQKSPLMPGPKRNERKRVASVLGDGEDQKSSKAPRTSLHFKSAATIIPDSQIVPGSQDVNDHSRYRY